METYDAYLVIRAPFNVREDQNNDTNKSSRRQKALNVVNQIYSERIADRSLKKMPLSVSDASCCTGSRDESGRIRSVCIRCLPSFADNPASEWLNVRAQQQHVVDFLNTCDKIEYKNKNQIFLSVSKTESGSIPMDGPICQAAKSLPDQLKIL